MSAWFPGGSGLNWADDLVFLGLAGGLIAWGRRTPAADADDWFLAGRAEHWAAAGLALVAAEVSALTVLGVPAASFREDGTFLQFFVGAAAARVVVAAVFIPAFFKDGAATPYAYLGSRFGPLTRAAGAFTFLTTRLLVSAVRLLAACVAAGFMLGWGPWPTLLLFTAVSIAAYENGGLRSAVRAGAAQTGLIVVVAVLSLLFLFRRVDGDLGAVLSLAGEAGKLRLLSGPGGFFAALLTGFFGSLAAFGADHELTQKLFAVKDAREARRAMFLSIAVSFGVLALFLAVGTLLFVFYKQNPGMALPERPDLIYPHFAVKMMGPVMRGLVLGAIALASLDAPLASLSSSFILDLRRPFAGTAPTPAAELLEARVAAGVFAIVLAILAGIFAFSEESLSFAFKAGGVAAGPLLGIFVFGLATKRRGDLSVLSAFGVMAALDLALLALSERGLLPIAWGWLVVLGAAGSFGLALLFTRDQK